MFAMLDDELPGLVRNFAFSGNSSWIVPWGGPPLAARPLFARGTRAPNWHMKFGMIRWKCRPL